MKKLLALLLCAVLCLSLAACASNTTTTETPAASTETAAEAPTETETAEAPAEEASSDAKQYVVGICQLVQHDALDAATNGFMDALEEALPVRSRLISRTLPTTSRPAVRSSRALSRATSI